MHERADRLAGSFVTVDQDLAHEFETRLVESSRLAFRVAFSVLRQREDAQDVAQEAFAKAYRSFQQLRDRDRFRAWLVRMTWRLALDRLRADKRRLIREMDVQVVAPATMDESAVGGNGRSNSGMPSMPCPRSFASSSCSQASKVTTSGRLRRCSMCRTAR